MAPARARARTSKNRDGLPPCAPDIVCWACSPERRLQDGRVRANGGRSAPSRPAPTRVPALEQLQRALPARRTFEKSSALRALATGGLAGPGAARWPPRSNNAHSRWPFRAHYARRADKQCLCTSRCAMTVFCAELPCRRVRSVCVQARSRVCCGGCCYCTCSSYVGTRERA